jgi:hypothetical protein
MKYLKFNMDYDNYEESVRSSVFWSILAYERLYELLHMQLWRKRKNKIILEDYSVTVEGRVCRPIKKWDIKSNSKKPYDYDSPDGLGLNQFFVGQNYKDEYSGDPGGDKGIYHDDCWIQPKNLMNFPLSVQAILGKETTTTDDIDLFKGITLHIPMSGWKWEIDVNGETEWKKIEQYDDWGKKLIESITQEDRVDGRYAVVVKSDGTTEEIKLEPYYNSLLLPNVRYEEVLTTIRYAVNDEQYATWVKEYIPIEQYVQAFGEIIFQEDTTTSVKFFGEATCRFYVFKNGLSFYLGGSQAFISTDINTRSLFCEAIIRFSPLVYMDTGDLVMNKIIFIDYWSDLFELYVHEDKEWWQEILPIIIIIVLVVIAYFTQQWYILNYAPALIGTTTGAVLMAAATFGAFIGAIGAISGIRWLQVVGMVLSLGTSVYSGFAAVTTGGANAMATESAKVAAMEALKSATVQQIIKYAFTDMLPSTFLQLFMIYRTITQKEFGEGSTEEVEDEPLGGKATITENDDEEFTDNVLMIARQHEGVLKV